jgi:hypothetical protein
MFIILAGSSVLASWDKGTVSKLEENATDLVSGAIATGTVASGVVDS